ncbi:MAG: hypothetical protein ACRCYX_15135 [Dermatophilaceae bacterium]
MEDVDWNVGALGAADTTGPRAEPIQIRNRVAACVEAVSRLQRDLRDDIPDAAQHLDLALGDLLDAYDAVELTSDAAHTHRPGQN